MGRKHSKTRHIPLSCLGPGAIEQIRATGIPVDALLVRERTRQHSQAGVPWNKFGVSAKDQRTLDGIVFASKLEMSVYRLLRDLHVPFTRQPSYELQAPMRSPSGELVRGINYVADFLIAGKHVVDTKGVSTPVYKVKSKLMAARGHLIHVVKTQQQMLMLLRDWGLLSH